MSGQHSSKSKSKADKMTLLSLLSCHSLVTLVLLSFEGLSSTYAKRKAQGPNGGHHINLCGPAELNMQIVVLKYFLNSLYYSF